MYCPGSKGLWEAQGARRGQNQDSLPQLVKGIFQTICHQAKTNKQKKNPNINNTTKHKTERSWSRLGELLKDWWASVGRWEAAVLCIYKASDAHYMIIITVVILLFCLILFLSQPPTSTLLGVCFCLFVCFLPPPASPTPQSLHRCTEHLPHPTGMWSGIVQLCALEHKSPTTSIS